MIRLMDWQDERIRRNIGFEVEVGSFEKLKKEMLEEFEKCNWLEFFDVHQ